ncbi:hypothetical protein DHEL01_v201795 [Diaporthe helianthi]|uniref:Uncharacterized protein n=1 Tax=Diaporthe helianthi TaxID=158607 RepID=A0A2P5IBD7_DIAHE|nr:hypothetical protein DHEL01_v201795 [Diaporthe helianthi]
MVMVVVVVVVMVMGMGMGMVLALRQTAEERRLGRLMKHEHQAQQTQMTLSESKEVGEKRREGVGSEGLEVGYLGT